MPATVETRSGRYTLAAARETEASFVAAVDDTTRLRALLAALWDQREAMAAAAKSHLGLGWRDDCRVLPMDAWVCGAFDASVVVEVQRGGKAIGAAVTTTTQYVFRVYVPHTLPEQQDPEAVDEKVCCDVAAYAWVEEHCTTTALPTPQLVGFGLAGGARFTHVRYRPWYSLTRLLRHVTKCVRRLLGLPLLSSYAPQRTGSGRSGFNLGFNPGLAYLLLEHVGPDKGQPLASFWRQHHLHHDQQQPATDHQLLRRLNLHRSLSRIVLGLARLPQPRIGSFVFDAADGTVRLRNRPLLNAVLQLEAAGAPRTMTQSQTYDRADVFAADLLALHDGHFWANPHAVRDAADARHRLAVRTLWRAVAPKLATTGKNDLFFPQLDLTPANLVVDDDWNVTSVLSLDGLAVLPAAALAVPHWLAGGRLHELRGEQYTAYESARRVFLQVMRQEEEDDKTHTTAIADTLEASWQSRAVWFWASLRSPSAWMFLFEDHMLPYFAPGTSVAQLASVASFWDANMDAVVGKKLADEAQYQAELQQLFEQDKPGQE